MTSPLLKAQGLYEKSYALLLATGLVFGAPDEDQSEACFSRGDVVIDLLCMAVFNNSAQLSFESNDYQQAMKYADLLRTFLFSIDTEAYDNTELADLMETTKLNFLASSYSAQQDSTAGAG